MFTALRAHLRALFGRNRIESELDAELRFHVEMAIQANVAAGMTPQEARRVALRDFGGVAQTKEAVRDVRALPLDSVRQDLRYAVRTFRRYPAFTLVALLTLAAGIGVNSAVFSLVDGVLFRPLPYRDPGRLVSIFGTIRSRNLSHVSVSVPDLLNWQHLNRTCEDLAAVQSSLSLYSTPHGDLNEQVVGRQVSENFFSVLGVQPALGRSFTSDEHLPGAEPVTVISDRLWRLLFGGDPAALGRSLRLATSTSRTPAAARVVIVGVMPVGWPFPTQLKRWAPDVLTPLILTETDLAGRTLKSLELIGRLKPGVSMKAASADLGGIARKLALANPQRAGNRLGPTDGVSLQTLDEYVTGRSRPTMRALFLGVSVVLLIACVNIANLLLARGADRRREIALRAALGASRRRLVRQLLTESLLLSCAGGLGGLVVAGWAVTALASRVPESLQVAKEVAVDWRLLAYTSLVALASGLLFGVVPALRLSAFRAPIGRDAGVYAARRRRPLPLHSTLVFAEVTLALVVLTGGALLVHSFLRLKWVELGYRTDGVLTMRVSRQPPGRRADQFRFFRDALDQIRTVPGVRTASVVDHPFLVNALQGSRFVIDGAPGDGERGSWLQRGGQDLNQIMASPGYFEMMGVRLLKGRLFTERDSLEDPPVVVISESVARWFGEGETPLGRRLRDGDDVREIVGIVRDVRDRSAAVAPTATVYVPFGTRFAAPTMTVLVRTAGEPRRVLPSVLARIHDVDSAAAIQEVRTVDELVGRSIAEQSFDTLLFATFALAALLLCAVGIYGVVAYAVAQRTQEVGVRMALGASRADVLRMAIGQAMRPVALGLMVGLAGAMAAARLVRSLLFEVTPDDPIAFVVVLALLAIVAGAASYVPARRATRVDPLQALRCE